jgi:hypothetical protein
LFETGQSRRSDPEHFSARCAAVVALSEDAREISDGEADVERALDDADAGDGGRRIATIAAGVARWSRQQAASFVESQCVGADARLLGQHSGSQCLFVLASLHQCLIGSPV